jgi:23S rRNA (adenine2503-C2)-methyltransferase
MKKTDLKALSVKEMRAFVSGLGLPGYRASQLLHWIYERRASSIGEMTELSKALREELEEKAYVSNLRLMDRQASPDGTEKYLFGLEDGESIESVLIPEAGRLTLCVSSQAGCAMGCRFCLTGRGGLRRNLRAYEIVDQMIAAARLVAPLRITNVVLMGMGEPLHNYTEVVEALSRMTGLLNLSGRRITVSTSGLAKRMLDLSRAAPSINLAVSLNATTDPQRDGIMPVNRKYPLGVLMEACRRYPLPRRRRITFEYVLMDGVNDSRADARRLLALIRGIPCKVNLIPLNEYEGCGFGRPPEARVLEFQKTILDAGVTAMIRKSKGQDISAACGQLRGSQTLSQGSQTLSQGSQTGPQAPLP